jgi:hypothetical protein
MATAVTVRGLPGLVQDANRPTPDYITDLTGKRYPLTSIDSAYAMANVTCQTLALGQEINAYLKTAEYAAAPDDLKATVQLTKYQLASAQASNFVCLAMLYRVYSLRPGFQTDYMKSRNLRLDTITAPDANGEWTQFQIGSTDDWVRVADYITRDVLRKTAQKPSITLTQQGATMQGMGIGINLLAPVVLGATGAGTAAAATTGAATAATGAGAAVVAAGGTVAQGIAALFSWPVAVTVVCVVGVYQLGNVTTFTIKEGMAAIQEYMVANTALQKDAHEEQKKLIQAYLNAKTPEEKQRALEAFGLWEKKIENMADSGGLINGLFGGSFDLQKIAYTALGLAGVYLGVQLFLKNRPAASASAAD